MVENYAERRCFGQFYSICGIKNAIITVKLFQREKQSLLRRKVYEIWYSESVVGTFDSTPLTHPLTPLENGISIERLRKKR